MVTSNISIINALLRITFGLTALAWATANMARRPSASSFIIAMIAAMKVGEGMTRFCPITALFANYRRVQAMHIKDVKPIHPA
ncbi:YgaP family membrane protein [Parageobacillus thermoglucosidasius]|uniref:YgaP family membrane protein n=1 Tax=Parageobacillus thermoglucosidasius TaxID=1426 RepID=UPI000B57A443|nr:DUF2892 domain-containing protein [Parageobacillus thermoglucosidasius]MBY6268236.1 DUF2892 domain-containing protein [Parageobacillus thermoglucosidasius]OUM87533.1 MAG: hypothetical protein BAA00_18380 [Parageobacillus thermoglucosidasius]